MAESASSLARDGFVVLPALVTEDALVSVREAYAEAIVRAREEEVARSESLRVNLVNGDPRFDPFFAPASVAALAETVLRGPFVLSTLRARTVLPGARAQKLHTDWSPHDDLAEAKLVGFIVPLDDFTGANGATRFVPGTHSSGRAPDLADPRALHPQEVLALARAGSCIVYDGRVWHGYTAHTSGCPRRSIQGAFVRRGENVGIRWRDRLEPVVRARLSPLARELLDLV
jgi:ectoine hydroxylase-related dioxygenase (phytanoyl-CoA dioxygenase family)